MFRSLEIGLTGLDDLVLEGLGKGDDKNVIRAGPRYAIAGPHFESGPGAPHGVDQRADRIPCARIDPWFISRLQEIVDLETKVRTHGLPETERALRGLKSMGFSDARLATLAGLTEAEVAQKRRSLGVRPSV